MPQLRAEDLTGWSPDRLEGEYRDRLNRVAAIRDAAGGTLINVTEPGAADEVRNLMADTNLLGERLDEARSLAGAEDQFVDREARPPTNVRPGPPTFPLNGSGGASDEPRDIAGRFLASDAWQAFKAEGKLGQAVTLPIASLFPGYRGIGETPRISAALFDTADYPSVPERRPAPVDVLYQPNSIGPLMAQGTTTAGSITYPVETVTASGAAAVAESGTKPEANLTFTATTEPVRKIAVLLPVTDEALEDEPFLRAYLNARLSLFVQNEEDRQLLVGDHTATPPQIRGILNRSGINAATSYSLGGANPDQALIDAMFSAQMRVRESFLLPDAQVMRSATWEIARLAKDANRMYLLGPPGEYGPLRVWGLPVVLNENMPAVGATNEPVLVGAFQAAAMLARRSGIDLAVSDSHGTTFAENKVTIRAEERVALAVFRPAGFATVTSAA